MRSDKGPWKDPDILKVRHGSPYLNSGGKEKAYFLILLC